ncbi:MAG TPA: PQQ-binding-like beta-propeller repeat protein [Dehalococcoidia bacterium]|nr:PQQ-binding-like beta-propeller repeat protein [Dehalococcoidia bacterium]
MKQWRVPGLLALSLLLLLSVTACAQAAGARGWAGAVQKNDLLLVSPSGGRLVGINRDGSQAWRFPDFWKIPNGRADDLHAIYGEPVFSADGRVVFVGDYNGYVYAFRPADYREGVTQESPPAASLKLNGPVIGGLALDSATDTLYVTSGKRVYSLRASELAARIDNRDASVRTAVLFEAGGDIWGTPVMDRGRLLVTSLDGGLYALDPVSGRVLWSFQAEKGLASTPLVTGAIVLASGFGGTLYAVDAASGALRWSFKAAHWIWGRPAIDDDTAYVGDFAGNVYAIDLTSGSERWSMPLGRGPLRASPAFLRGTVVVGSDDGWLVGIDPSTRTKRWERKLSTSLNADLTAGDDQVLIAPGGCVRPEPGAERIYYTRVDPVSGELQGTEAVC